MEASFLIPEYDFRIDPAQNGIHLVDVENGGERVYIPFNKIDHVINLLQEAKTR